MEVRGRDQAAKAPSQARALVDTVATLMNLRGKQVGDVDRIKGLLPATVFTDNVHPAQLFARLAGFILSKQLQDFFGPLPRTTATKSRRLCVENAYVIFGEKPAE